MSDHELTGEIELRRKRHNSAFSNYENAVTLISSLEAWVHYRWGRDGREKAGLLEAFDRFPNVDGLTPDFEIRFTTPYVIWGDHKRTMQPAAKSRTDADQIIKYAARRPASIDRPLASSSSKEIENIDPGYDIMVLVGMDNDDVAAESIKEARALYQSKVLTEDQQQIDLAPIVVLGSYLERESINGEWFKIKWRSHHDNQKFSPTNICEDRNVDDLNTLITGVTHLAMPVDKPSLTRSGRNPFINDTPPPIYTALRLVVPAINSLLTDDDRDVLQSSGRVEKLVTREDILSTEFVTSLKPQPRRLCKWIEGALEFMAKELSCARLVSSAGQKQYIVTIDNRLLKSDPVEMWADRAATRAAKHAIKSRKRKASDDKNQFRLFQ